MYNNAFHMNYGCHFNLHWLPGLFIKANALFCKCMSASYYIQGKKCNEPYESSQFTGVK